MEDRFLILNAVECLECGEILESHNRHDYKTCSCPNSTMVDGGLDYERFGGKDLTKVKSQSIYSDAPFEVVREALYRGGRGINSDEPLTYTKLSEMNDGWVLAVIKYEEERRPDNKYLPFFREEKKYRKI